MDDVENLHVGFKHSHKGDKGKLWYGCLSSACDTLAFAHTFWEFFETFNLRHNPAFDGKRGLKTNVLKIIDEDTFEV
ncbi:hypothetical protein A6A05_19220 [Magnetospirillum moscoviense]|uniref:Uncharacterized protein n=1 Tax=Magnetospirillum moscoviense TaxID=1437059 RepID=A0A178MYD7_9PROT|nr:hypothetical protein A6A05_19220 [Magnetospirillum moscoviense]